MGFLRDLLRKESFAACEYFNAENQLFCINYTFLLALGEIVKGRGLNFLSLFFIQKNVN